MFTKIGLDLGYANITLSDSNSGIYREPSVALVYKESRADSNRIISVGTAALESDTVGKDGREGILVRPFKNGILFDNQLTRDIIFSAISPIKSERNIRCILGVPSDILPKQERELFAMLTEAGVTTCLSVTRPIAALIGAGYSPDMSVISVNIGAANTDIAIINKGNIIHSRRFDIGGENFDKAVKQFVFDQGDVNISLSVARAIKEKLGAVWAGRPNDSIDIEGTLSLTGNKLRMNVTTEDIVGVFEEPLQALIKAIIDTIKIIPSDMVEGIFANGIVLSGGGAELFGIDALLGKVLGISVTKAQNPIDAVAKGLARINSFISAKSRLNGKNITSLVAKLYLESKNK